MSRWAAIGLVAAAAFVLGPVYVLPSGLPQPGDALATLAIVLVLVANHGRVTASRGLNLFVGAAVLLVLYIAIVNIGWVWVSGYPQIAFNILYYAYNVAIVLGILTLHARLGARLVTWMTHLTAATLLVQVALIPVLSNGRLRQTPFFNNPNQLAEYALEGACIFYVCSQVVRTPTWYRLLVYGAATLLTWVSVSRAAFAGWITLVFVLFAGRPAAGVVVALAGLGAAAWFDVEPGSVLEHLGRVVDLSSGADRGYDRMFNHSQYLLFGAGEGVPQRFTTSLQGLELHSSLGTLLFSYGILGLGLFVVMLYGLYLRAGTRLWVALLPPMVVGLAHQGLRFTTLWILFAMIAVAADHLPDRHRGEPEPGRSPLPRRSPGASRLGAPRPAGSESR